MNYRVFWEPHAEGRLVEMLRNSGDAKVLSEAAMRIDSALAVDPIGFGESRYDTLRIGFVRPLAVQYDVMSDVRTIIVYDVWRIDLGSAH